MKNRFTQTILALAIALGMGQASFAEEAAKERETFTISDPVAVIDGKELPKKEFLDFVTLTIGEPVEEYEEKGQVQGLVEAYFLQKHLSKEATKKGLDKDEDYKMQMQYVQDKLLSDLFLLDFLMNTEVSEEELKKEYDKQVELVDKEEYKASHILVESEEEAKALIKDINDKKIEFAKAAEEHSLDPGTAVRGGDIGGWFRLQMMDADFAAALAKMKKGEMSKEPVKTGFGYHIILVEDMRDTVIDTFEGSKERLRGQIAQTRLQEYILGLQDEIKIEIKEDKK